METRPDVNQRATYEPAVNSPPPEKAAVVEDFIDIFHAPSSVFARRTNSGFGMHLLLVSIIAALFGFANRSVTTQIADAQYSRRIAQMMADNPRLTQEAAEQGRGIAVGIETFSSYIGAPIILLVSALFVWLFARIVTAKISYRQSAMIMILAYIPALVGMLIVTVQIVLMDTSNVTDRAALSLSPARFMDPGTANPKLYGAATTLEAFGIWTTVLTGIGIAVMGRVSKARGLTAALLMFLIGVTIAVIAR